MNKKQDDKEDRRRAELARKAENARLLAEEEASAPAKAKAAPKAASKAAAKPRAKKVCRSGLLEQTIY